MFWKCNNTVMASRHADEWCPSWYVQALAYSMSIGSILDSCKLGAQDAVNVVRRYRKKHVRKEEVYGMDREENASTKSKIREDRKKHVRKEVVYGRDREKVRPKR